MQKIPTIFVRDFTNNGKITREWYPDCFGVRDGLATATRKIDGTSCMIRDGRLYKRFEWLVNKPLPAGFEPAGTLDTVTGKYAGWVPVGMGPEDQWHREAMEKNIDNYDGTFELIGPKIQGNPHVFWAHTLLRHGQDRCGAIDLTYDGIQSYLTAHTSYEGIVWWMHNEPVGKIKRRDFGLPWPVKA